MYSSVLNTGNILRIAGQHVERNALTTEGHKNRELVHALRSIADERRHRTVSQPNHHWTHVNLCKKCPTCNAEFCLVRHEKHGIRITTKIFLSTGSCPEVISKGITNLKNDLNVDNFHVDMLILSLPQGTMVKDMVPFLNHANRLVQSGIVGLLGVADLCTSGILELEHLLGFKVMAVQVNTSNHRNECTRNTAKWALREQREVFMHTDKRPYITSEKVNEILGDTVTPVVDISSVLRYSVIAEKRSVLLAKGYFLFLQNQE